MQSLKLLALCSLLVLFPKPLLADEYEEWMQELEEWVQRDSSCGRPYNILDTRSLSELQALTAHSNNSIATQAAWKTVHLAIEDKQLELTDFSRKQKISWFIGFLEGRNRVLAPDWWKQVVLDAYGDDNRIDPSPPKNYHYHSASLGHFSSPVHADMFQSGKDITYIEGDDKFLLPKSLFTETMSGAVTGKFKSDRFFVERHHTNANPHTLACFDRSDNKMLWSVKTCGCSIEGAGAAYAEAFRVWIELVPIDDHRVIVYGSSRFGFYVHGFDQSDGKTLFMLSSNF